MNRRLRKKLWLGEFQELGFQVWIRLDPSLDIPRIEALIYRWLGECIEPRDLQTSAGTAALLWDGGVAHNRRARGRAGRKSHGRRKLKRDRDQVAKWLREQPEVLESRLSRFVDWMYGPWYDLKWLEDAEVRYSRPDASELLTAASLS